MKKLISKVPGETSNWRKTNLKAGTLELNLYAPKDSDPETMEEMIKDFPMEEIKAWIKKWNYQNLIVVDPT